MRRRMMVVLGLTLAVGAAASQGQGIEDQWDMRVHSLNGTRNFALVDVDSITFHPRTVTVPAGAFTMGDGVAYCGADEHEVTLTRDFYLGQHEVTNQEYMEAA